MWSVFRHKTLILAALLICCFTLVLLWYLPINLDDLSDNQSDTEDDDGWGMDFPGHQTALIIASPQRSLSDYWYT